ncbi:hypothetical protein SAMN05216302_100751 [Nitrosomonas aestuarii]|uniref:Probable membrane transporter protein n=1 Tax=Nitrosomonas aestuarii TaxID=52441 RepID=A0A1I3ZTA1_9PROT|nr:sulfite exporter TauE/SafE family protein [Nitrosomonas aestuarii]SFK47243.1 hypothetical protein SAMN05216302_100751 [Nitrosomonas aestuarii]
MEWMIIGIAGFLGGMLNAVAGGGSFITLPALIFVEVSPVSANATGAAALLPGYIVSAWRFRHDIEFPAGLNFPVIMLIAVSGGCLGAAILLMTSEQLFSVLIPWLILLATAAFIVGPRLLQKKKTSMEKFECDRETSSLRVFTTCLVLFTVCVYGGYFNGGLGIILLAALGLTGQTNLLGMNGVKNIISALITAVAVAVYAAGGTISEEHLFLLGVMAVLGGYAGAAFAYRIPHHVLRGIIVLIGCLMSAAFFFSEI